MKKKQYSFINLFLRDKFVVPMGSIIQVEELTMNPGSEIPRHVQQCVEITYVISGQADIYCGNEYITVGAGDVHVISKDLEHSIVVKSDKMFRFICIGVILDEGYADIERFIKLMYQNKNFVVKDNGDIRILSEMLLNEFYRIDDMSNIIINSSLNQIFALICRVYSTTSPAYSADTRFAMKSDYTLYNILRYIDRECTNIKSVKEIAEKFLYHENYLSHLFKNKLGMSVKQYIVHRKMLVAQKLLKTTDLSIENIATELNFSTAHSFYQAFKSHYGISPLQYRKKYFDHTQL